MANDWGQAVADSLPSKAQKVAGHQPIGLHEMSNLEQTSCDLNAC